MHPQSPRGPTTRSCTQGSALAPGSLSYATNVANQCRRLTRELRIGYPRLMRAGRPARADCGDPYARLGAPLVAAACHHED